MTTKILKTTSTKKRTKSKPTQLDLDFGPKEVPVAVVIKTEEGWQVQVWQGRYDVNKRIWMTEPVKRAQSGTEIPSQRLAFLFAEEMAEDLHCVDVTSEFPN